MMSKSQLINFIVEQSAAQITENRSSDCVVECGPTCAMCG